MTHFECILLTFIFTLLIISTSTSNTVWVSKKMLKNSKQITFEDGSIWLKIDKGSEQEWQPNLNKNFLKLLG